MFKSSVIWPLGGTLLMVTISRLRNVSGIISPLTTRSSRIKYLLTQMYELLRTKEENDIFTCWVLIMWNKNLTDLQTDTAFYS